MKIKIAKVLTLFLIFLFLIGTTGCSKKENQISATIVTDLDVNIYNTVKIGTQTWMVENLKTSKYSMPKTRGFSVRCVKD